MYLLKVFLISHWLIILKKDCFLKTSDFYSGSDVENQKKVDCPDLFEALFNKSQKVILPALLLIMLFKIILCFTVNSLKSSEIQGN